MPAPQPYQGHRSWNAWNVSLWISNDEPLYRSACAYIRHANQVLIERARHYDRPTPTKEEVADRAAAYFVNEMDDVRTPDGGRYTHLAVKLALEGLME